MKKSAGQNFLKKFINLREKEGHIVTGLIETWLDSHRIPYVEFNQYDHQTKGLLQSFFNRCHILHINPGKTTKVIVGKGVCYDSGGYDLKTRMADMFYDKNGALLSIAAAIDNDVSCVVFFVNNLIHYNAPVAGDIIKDVYTGLNVLIDDTDAEGRIGLAHCIGLAKELGYESILTIATLTGAAVQITGERTYAMTHSNRRDDLVKVLSAVVQDSGLELWPAPFHEEYDKSIQTKIIGADVRSCGEFKGAGSSTAFSFLKMFSKESHHIHLDIAGQMCDKDKNGLIFGLPEVRYLLELL